MDDLADDLALLKDEHETVHAEVTRLRERGAELRAAYHMLIAQRDTMASKDFLAALQEVLAQTTANLAALQSLTRFTQQRIDERGIVKRVHEAIHFV